MVKKLVKGNVALCEGAIAAGLDAYFPKESVIDALVSLFYLLTVYGQYRGIHDSRIKPDAQTGITIGRNRITITDFETRRTFRHSRTTFLQDGIFGNFPVKHVIRLVIIV